MKIAYKVVYGIKLGVQFIALWIAAIFIALPYDMINGVCIERHSVKEMLNGYKWTLSYYNYIFAQEWKSLFRH